MKYLHGLWFKNVVEFVGDSFVDDGLVVVELQQGRMAAFRGFYPKVAFDIGALGGFFGRELKLMNAVGSLSQEQLSTLLLLFLAL